MTFCNIPFDAQKGEGEQSEKNELFPTFPPLLFLCSQKGFFAGARAGDSIRNVSLPRVLLPTFEMEALGVQKKPFPL